MDAIARLQLLTRQMHLEPAEECSFSAAVTPQPVGDRAIEQVYIHPAVLPGGRRIKLLKTLLTSACERDCNYCPFRAGRNFRRASFRPEEFANLFMALHRAGAVEGIFLSSGVAGGGVRTQDRILDTAEILRNKLGFRGYMHLKIMPGAEKVQVERLMCVADRVSVNLEAPNPPRLAALAPHKRFDQDLLEPLGWVEQIRRSQPAHLHYKGRWPSSVTQFVAGGAGEADVELLSTTAWLYTRLHLRRAYYSAFNPVPDTPLEDQPPVNPLRALRLYQASFLLRDYGYDLEELPLDADGNLPLDSDPKRAWAEQRLRHDPVEINTADRQQLLRLPGIGPRLAERILHARRQGSLRDLSSLKSLGVNINRLSAYVLLSGRRPATQLSLF